MKNRFIFWILYFYNLCRKKRPVSDVNKKFLVVSTTALGDSIWATPALACLKNSFQDCSIDVLTSPIGRQVLEGNPRVKEIFIFPKKLLPLLSLFFKMRKKKYDTALFFHTSQRHVLPFCYLLGIPELVGIQKDQKGLDDLLSKKIEKKVIHEVKKRLEIVEACGGKAEERCLEIFFGEKHLKVAEDFLEKAEVDNALPLIALHPGAKDRFKQWPPEAFIELGMQIKKEIPCNLIITGSGDEKALVEKISNRIPGSIPLRGELALKPFAALIQKLDLLVIGDTGPMHIAFSQKTPTVALFCATDPKLCGPHLPLQNVQIFSQKPTCSPCLKKKCKEPFCLFQISPDAVFRVARELIESKK